MPNAEPSILEQLRPKVMRPLAAFSPPLAFGTLERPVGGRRELHDRPGATHPSPNRRGATGHMRTMFRPAGISDSRAEEAPTEPGVELTVATIIRGSRIPLPEVGAGALPERRLMLADLEDALAAYLTHANAGTQRGRRTLDEIRAW